ncbi:predicted protein [Postia placenta Mad-698-R]|nr:predicted protein [Postia placenta Mad-698-R]
MEPMDVDWDAAQEARHEPMQIDCIGSFKYDVSMDWSTQDYTANDGCTATKSDTDAILSPCTAIINVVGLPSPHGYGPIADAANEGFQSWWFETVSAAGTPGSAATQDFISGGTVLNLFKQNIFQLDLRNTQGYNPPEPL